MTSETGMPDILSLTQQRTEQNELLLAGAYKSFQAASRTKDEDPVGFEAARMRYYTLKKGPAWAAQEKQRIAGDKIDPIIAQFRDAYQSLLSEESVQKAYTDSVSAVRDQQQNLTDNAEKHVSFFGKLIDTEQQKKSAFNRMVELTTQTPAGNTPIPQNVPAVIKYFSKYPASFSTILDVVLALIILFILYLGLRKVSLTSLGQYTFWNNLLNQQQHHQPMFSPSIGPVRHASFQSP